MEQRIAGLRGLDFWLAQIGGLDVGSGVAVEAHTRHVQENGSARAAGMIGRLGGGAMGGDDIQAVALDVFQRRAVGKRRLDPATRGAHGNPDPVVLAHEDDRHWPTLEGGPAGGVNRPLGGGVIGRGVAEAAHDDAIVGQWLVLQAKRLGETNGVGRPHRLGQVRGDGAGLRWDEQGLGTQHFMTAAGDWVLRRGSEAEQHVPGRGLARDPLGAVNLEGGVAVVEERHVVHPEGLGDGGHALMPGAADRVETFATALKRAGDPVELAAQHLGMEDVHQSRRRQAGAIGDAAAVVARSVQGLYAAQKALMYGLRWIHLRRPVRPPGPVQTGSR